MGHPVSSITFVVDILTTIYNKEALCRNSASFQLQISLYGIMKDIRVSRLKFWERVKGFSRKLVLNGIIYNLCSFQVTDSFSKITFPWQHKNMYSFQKFHVHF